MKKVRSLLFILAAFFAPASAQIKIVPHGAPDLEVGAVTFSLPAPASAFPASTALFAAEENVRASNGAEDSRNAEDPRRPVHDAGRVPESPRLFHRATIPASNNPGFTVELRASGTKEIRRVWWAFTLVEQQQGVRRFQYSDAVRMKGGDVVTLTKSVKSDKRLRSALAGIGSGANEVQVEVKRIEYSDGTFWQR